MLSYRMPSCVWEVESYQHQKGESGERGERGGEAHVLIPEICFPPLQRGSGEEEPKVEPVPPYIPPLYLSEGASHLGHPAVCYNDATFEYRYEGSTAAVTLAEHVCVVTFILLLAGAWGSGGIRTIRLSCTNSFLFPNPADAHESSH